MLRPLITELSAPCLSPAHTLHGITLQGKTSRWGVAWSWQVDPNKASQPLRRMQPEGEGALGAGREGGRQQQQGEEEEGDEGQERKRPHRDAAGGAAGAGARPVLPRRMITFTVVGVASEWLGSA